MPTSYLPYEPNQDLLLPHSLREWLPEDHLAHYISETIETLDLRAFYARIVTPRPSITAGRSTFTWRGELLGTPMGDAPSILNASYHFKAEVEIPQGGAEGMIVTEGGRFGGWGFYLLKGKPVFLWNLE